MSEKVLMKGNEVLAESAMRAGCKYFFGYPITPQTELSAYMSKHMPKIGGTFLQAESEVAAINMVYGAAAAGARVMTSSSSPGISLKSEGVSYIAGADLPAVIINVMRGGPGLGSIQPSSRTTGRRRAPWATAISRWSSTRPRPCRRWPTTSPRRSTLRTSTAHRL